MLVKLFWFLVVMTVLSSIIAAPFGYLFGVFLIIVIIALVVAALP